MTPITMPKRRRPAILAPSMAATLPVLLLATHSLAALPTSPLVAHPSRHTHILREETLRDDAATSLIVTSDVPVTIQRVPVHTPHIDRQARVVVTSDCDTTQTDVVPIVDIVDGRSIRIESGARRVTRSFLESTWYRVAWSAASDACHPRRVQETASTTPPVDAAAINDYCGKTWLDAYDNCPLPCPAGNDDCAALGEGYACQQYTACYDRMQSGTFVGGGDSATASTGIATIQGTVATENSSNTTTWSAATTTSPPVNILDTTGNATLAANTTTTTTTNSTVFNSTDTIPPSTTEAATNRSTDMPASTPPSTSQSDIFTTDQTDDFPNSPPTLPPIFPTYRPTASHPPSSWTYSPSYIPTASSSSLRPVYAAKILTMLMALAVVAVFWSGRDDGDGGLSRGTMVVAAAMVASVYSSFYPKDDSVGKVETARNGPRRQLPTCAFHVDILVSCHYGIRVDAPVSRVVYGGLEEVVAFGPTGEEEDECVTNYDAKLVFASNDWKERAWGETVMEPTC